MADGDLVVKLRRHLFVDLRERRRRRYRIGGNSVDADIDPVELVLGMYERLPFIDNAVGVETNETDLANTREITGAIGSGECELSEQS